MTAEPGVSWRRNQAAVTFATFIGFASFTLVMPFLPLYFASLGVEDAGEIALWSGISLGVTPAITALLAPASARMADRRGRKFMVVRSLSGFVVIMVAMAMVTAPWQVVGLRALLGLVAGYGPIAITMAAETAPPEHLATAIGWVQTAQRLGPAIGPVLGGLLVQSVGIRRGFLVAACVYLFAVVLVLVAVREPRQPGRRDADTRVRRSWVEARGLMPQFTLLLAMVFGLQLVDRSFGPILPLYLQETGMSIDRVAFWSGVLFTAMAASAALGNQVAGWFLRRGRAVLIVTAATACAAAGATIFAFGASEVLLIGTATIFGLGIGVATTALYAMAGRHVAAEDRGLAFGYLTTAYLVGLAVSPIAAGAIGAASMRAVFLADAAGLGTMAWIASRRLRAPIS
jgi:DHA1 family multidrug resistance protein-like MFS transporter